MSFESVLREIAILASDAKNASLDQCNCGIDAYDALKEIALMAREEADRIEYFTKDALP